MRIPTPKPVLSTAILVLFLLSSSVGCKTGEEKRVIQNDSLVTIEYTLLDEQGNKIESNKGGDPLKYIHGKGEIIPGLENGLEGLQVGERKTIRLKPDDAYGPIIPDAFQEVPRKDIPTELLKVGANLVAQGSQGEIMPVRIHEIREKTVVLDYNHPLAGKTLNFEVKILTIESAQEG
ncbi:MAG: peptidylprolyl isomerase [Candidatus Binatia bacterium]